MEALKIIDYSEEIKEVGEEVKEKWCIQNDETAEWWIEKKEEELAEVRRYQMAIKNKVDALNVKLLKAIKEERDIIDTRNIYLEEYFKTLDEKQLKKTKTLAKYRLPSGEIRFKYPGPDYKKDDGKLENWLKANKMNEFIETEVVTKLKWGELKKLTTVIGNQLIFEETGEIIEGVTVIEREPVFEVDLK